jgi:hypothetical protein
VSLPVPRRHHLLVAGLLAVLAAASLLFRGPVKGTVEESIPTTFSTEPGGLQGLYMLSDGVGLPVGRYQGRLEDLDPETVPALAVVGFAKRELDVAPLFAWVEAGGSLLLVSRDERLLLPLGLRYDAEGTVETRRGAGRVLHVADPAPLTNRGLEKPENAVLAVRLLEKAAGGNRIDFCETIHGYGGGGDPNAAMARILLRTPLGNAALAAALFTLLHLIAEARRFGRVRRFLDRPRRSEYEYLDALAGLLVAAKAWPQAGRLLLLGVARRSGVDRPKLTVRAVAESLAWDRPADGPALRAGAEALAAGNSAADMVAGLRTLDRALPPERAHDLKERMKEKP